jgi:hypothetical protein
MNIVECFNQAIEAINEAPEPTRQQAVLDIKFEIALEHLKAIATRALEINDEEILRHLSCLGIVRPAEEKEQTTNG